MPTSGPLKWHGGKAYQASKIVALMPPHIHYVEPYFGGGAVLFAKDPLDVSEVVNDLDGALVNFWRVLRSEALFASFERLAQAMPFAEAEWTKSGASSLANSEEGDVPAALAFFVRCRQSLAGRMKGFTGVTKTRTRRRMNNEVSAWLTAVEGLPDVHSRLKRVLILNRDALDVIQKHDTAQTCFYLDPPYLHETRATTGEYAHEMTTEQHRALLDVLAGVKGKFLLSGYPSPLYDEAAARHGWRIVTEEYDNKSSHKKVKDTKTECVWMNFEPLNVTQEAPKGQLHLAGNTDNDFRLFR